MDRLKRFIFPLMILVLLVSLGVSLRSYFMTYLIQPVALLFWAAWRALSSVHQHTYWILLIGLCSLVVIRFALTGKGATPPSAYIEDDRRLSQVEYWSSLINEAVLGANERVELSENLMRMLQDALADEARASLLDIDRVSAIGGLPLSKKARQFLLPRESKSSKLSLLRPRNLLGLAPGWLRGWLSKLVRQDYTVMDEILTYIEAELEMRHEN